MNILLNICAHDGIISHYTGVGTIVKRYIKSFSNILNNKKIFYDINLFTPQYNKFSYGYSDATKKYHESLENITIFQISNDSNGTINYGRPKDWRKLSQNTAKVINSIDFSKYTFIITIANDTPYAGILEMLKEDEKHYKIWIPHSTGKIHRVDSAIKDSEKILVNRLKWEQNAINFINKDKNSYLGVTGNYIGNHLINEYSLKSKKALSIFNGEILSEETIYEENEAMKELLKKIEDYDEIIMAFGRAEEYKNLDATMFLGEKLGIKSVVIAQPYFEGQPIIEDYKKKAKKTNSQLFVNVPFYFPQYIIRHFNKPMILLIPSKKEIVGLIINEVRKMNKDNVLIVANDIGGMHEQIDDGKDGILVDLNKIEESAKKILKYFDAFYMKQFNKNSQERLKRQYDFEKICEKFLDNFIRR